MLILNQGISSLLNENLRICFQLNNQLFCKEEEQTLKLIIVAVGAHF